MNSLAHAHHSRGELGDWYEQLFGLRTLHAPPLAYARTSFVSRVLQLPLDQRGSAIHHISFEVHDMQTAIAACEFHGVSVIAEQSGQTEGGRWHEAFIPPEHTGGMLVQFFAWETAEPSAQKPAPSALESAED